MTIPQRVRVGDSTWKVRRRREVLCEGVECDGIADYESKTITLKRDLEGEDLLSTFLHELLHAVDHEFKLRLTHPTIYALEGPLAKVFLANPSLGLLFHKKRLTLARLAKSARAPRQG